MDFIACGVPAFTIVIMLCSVARKRTMSWIGAGSRVITVLGVAVESVEAYVSKDICVEELAPIA